MTKGIYVRGKKNPDGTSNWILVGEYRDENGKQFILLNSLAVSPNVLQLAADPGRNLICNLYDMDTANKPLSNKKKSQPAARSPSYFEDDDIPF
jgi:hypothetical protein